MGITRKDCKSLFFALKQGADFRNTLTLGRLHLYATSSEILSIANEFNIKTSVGNITNLESKYAEPFFKLLGAHEISSLDYSDYEDATIIHDLNLPVPSKFKNRFSAIIDSGTLEHVFNFPTGIKNCMEALEIGGFFIGISPTNNQLGHGFYQFSPELSYRIFSKENGFEIVNIFVTSSDQTSNVWYEVADPAKVNSRVMLVNNQPLVMITIARKIKETDVFQVFPQQIDYVNTWNAHNETVSGVKLGETSKLKFYVRKYIPTRIISLLHIAKRKLEASEEFDDILGFYNKNHFTKVELSKF